MIKWVNDIYLEGKKRFVEFYLEAVSDMESGEIRSVIIGVGLNFRSLKRNFLMRSSKSDLLVS